jgi:hypothetical protein
MDKYSKQIIKFISENKILENKYIYNNLKSINFINIMLEKAIKVNNCNIILPIYKIKIIPKLHNINDPPLAYYFFKQYNPEIKTLKDFIKYYCLNQHNLNLNKIKSSISDKNLLKIFDNVYERIDDRQELCEKFYQNIFVSIDILQEIESFDLKHIIIDETYYKLSVYYYDISDIDNYLIKIIKIINLIKEINNHYELHNNLKYNVIIFLGNQKKQFIGDKITPITMNSGACIPEVYVCIWRKEELEKVLIHELLHFINCDFHSHINGYDDIDKGINNLINIDGINNPNEAYNETVAGIINMCWKSIILQIDINKIYYNEMNFLYLQSAKLIKYFKGNKIEDLLPLKNITIRQTTSAISYLFLKMVLFNSIVQTCEFIEKMNLKCNEYEKINKFNKFLIDKLNNISYKENVNKYLDLINLDLINISKINDSKFIYKTMRMSIF